MTKYKIAGTSATSPLDHTERKRVVIRNYRREEPTPNLPTRVYVFFIGGAGDKRAYPPLPAPDKLLGPHGNIVEVKEFMDKKIDALGLTYWYISIYLGYYEIYGNDKIKENVLACIPDKKSPIFIVGHSLGGWNGAHLSGWLNNAGYHMEMLVTLDPVGEGFWISTTSNIPHRRPQVAARKWINIRAEAKEQDFTDDVANFGGQWTIKAGPTIDVTVDTNHANAIRMFKIPVSDGRSTADHLLDSIRRFTQ